MKYRVYFNAFTTQIIREEYWVACSNRQEADEIIRQLKNNRSHMPNTDKEVVMCDSEPMDITGIEIRDFELVEIDND